MSKELTVAYSRLKREWPGLLVRQARATKKGSPDFVMVHAGHVIFTEVKWLCGTKYACPSPTQAYRLDELAGHGATTCLLVGHEWGWLAWGPKFQGRSPQEYRMGEPSCCWAGPSLAGDYAWRNLLSALKLSASLGPGVKPRV